MATSIGMSTSSARDRQQQDALDASFGMLLLWIGPAIAFVVALVWGW
jgi:hypothetical protein